MSRAGEVGASRPLGLPLALVAAGVVVLVGTDFEGVGEARIAAAICTVIANLLLRFGFRGQGDRDREATARAFSDRNGRWPDETRPG